MRQLGRGLQLLFERVLEIDEDVQVLANQLGGTGDGVTRRDRPVGPASMVSFS
jgi:hypothetical protein